MNIDSSPIEIPKFKVSLRGYNQREVDQFLTKLRRDYQEIVHQNEVLGEEVKQLREEIKEYTSKKARLEDALISAQKSAQLISENSQEQAKLTIKDAEIKAHKILEEGERRLEKLRNELVSLNEQKRLFLTKLKSLIKSHSELLDFYEEELPEKEGEVKKKIPKDEELPFNKQEVEEQNTEPVSLENDHSETITFEDE
ncbi:DivIVA domain-containing protein [Candidatus Aerophobetes bacterium]|uniref:DivIVA domain-containing protein n=1 Tax=Aerophobetes bacterium TaxID=2030807 RepID=A0A523UM51_UNCAE|nr:MAG: DivIVA domain-containing protein [Candidatus Aerophobetes bacterium]